MFEIGNSLREARLRQGLEFADIERVTKIRPKYLRALEDENFDVLPAQTYVKGFLRTYAEFLGLDGQLYLDEFNSRYVTRDEDPPFRPRRSAGPRPRGRRAESSVVLGALVGIAIVFALVIAAWRSSEDSPQRAPTPGVLRPATEPDAIVRAVRGATRMEVRDGSRFGKLRFSGTLENGRQQRFELRDTLWMYLQRPASVDLVVAGRSISVPGRTVLVDERGARRAPAR